MSICSLLLSSMAAHAMMEPVTEKSFSQWKQEDEKKAQWEEEHPGQIYQSLCNPVHKLKPGYVLDKSGAVVAAATIVNNETQNAPKKAQTSNTNGGCSPIKN